MKHLFFNMAVARTNPVIFRQIHLQSDSNVSDLLVLARITFGIEENAEMLFTVENNIQDVNTVLSDVLKVKDSGTIVVREEGNKIFRKNINILVDLVAEKRIEEPLPDITFALGLNLPSDQYEMGSINKLHKLLLRHEQCEDQNGSIYSRKALWFSEKKTKNAIRKYFAPGTEYPEINMKIALPMAAVLQAQKVADLKQIVNDYHLYTYGNRKNDIIADITRRFDTEFIGRVFHWMTPEEYTCFKEYVLDDRLSVLPDEAIVRLKTLSDCGLLATVSKKGVMIAEEVLSYYETWYDTPEEKAFIPYKYMEYALAACSQLYGVFSKEMFVPVVKMIDHGLSESRMIDAFWEVNQQNGKDDDYRVLKKDVLYHSNFLTKKEATEIWQRALHEDNCWYIPAESEIMHLLSDTIRMSKRHEEAIIAHFNETLYYSDYARSLYFRVIAMIRKNEDLSEIMTMIKKEVNIAYWRQASDTTLNAIEKIVKKEMQTLPLFILGGYSVTNAPKSLMEHYHQQMEEKKKEAAKKKAAPAKKRNKRRQW